MFINLETAKKLVDYQKLERENKHLRGEVIYYIGVIRKYEEELLKINEKERGKRRWKLKQK